MAKKVFKIGEYCAGGIIEAQVSKQRVTIINKEWDHSKGTRKSSDQSGARVISTDPFSLSSPRIWYDLEMFLNTLTTSYYAGQIISWAKSKI